MKNSSPEQGSLAAYEIEFTSSAEKAFRRLPQAVRRRFSAAFELLRQDPRRHRPRCEVRRLSGAANAWRLRVGTTAAFMRSKSRKSFSPGLGTGGHLAILRRLRQSGPLDRRSDEVPPIRPGAVVVPDVRVAEEVLQDEPGVR